MKTVHTAGVHKFSKNAVANSTSEVQHEASSVVKTHGSVWNL